MNAQNVAVVACLITSTLTITTASGRGNGRAASPAVTSPSRARSARLSDFIAKRQPKAAKYSAELAGRIIVEGKRHGLRPEWLAAISWIESDFNSACRGRHGEHGVWQLRPWDHDMQIGWTWLRAHSGEFPVVQEVPAVTKWKRLRRHRIKVISDIRAGTYLAAFLIKRHARMCRRLGHLAGRFTCRRAFINQCPKVHPFEIDRLAHFNSGVSWPKAGYLRKLRRRSKIIKQILEGKS